MIADLHIHSKFSYDSVLSPSKILKVAKKRRLNMIAITDHETIRGGVETQKLNNDKDFFVIIGCEINTEIGDIIGLNLNEEINSRDSFEVIREIKDQAGIVILPHPFRGHRLTNELVNSVDAIEIYNGRSSLEENFKSKLLARKNKKLCVIGSDAHFAAEIGNTYMKINDDYTDNLISILRIDITEFEGCQCPRCFVDASQAIRSMKKMEYIQGLHNLALFLVHAIKEGC